MLHAQHLHVSLGRQTVLQDISFEARPGEVTALLGPNGSGKTTLLKTLAGLLPARGQLQWQGRPRNLQHGGQLHPSCGYLPQDCSTRSRLTVEDAVLLGRLGTLGWRVSTEQREAVRQQLATLGLAALAGRRLCELSGGQRQMVFLAQVLLREPSLLLLDEPISALDLQHQVQVMCTVREQTRERGLTSVVVLHDLNAALAYADCVLLLRQGRLVATGNTVDILTPATLAPVFGVTIHQAHTATGHSVLCPHTG
ncbi:ABC transporter ATP-binding protein [Vogesella fluminis]|uniref:ABC transporter ATP-binding protein n=1 Tax=Vogesella fluminis TaxID=1069161 RepID=A0ABQ3H722_9NEIS|nr:ABC transporter ATP-binding protein [Vogesella fluminis]GHD72763.1 ABC transporter ATP-binding protein [Vogesella fluminis]